jgi:hypothetical protein
MIDVLALSFVIRIWRKASVWRSTRKTSICEIPTRSAI